MFMKKLLIFIAILSIFCLWAGYLPTMHKASPGNGGASNCPGNTGTSGSAPEAMTYQVPPTIMLLVAAQLQKQVLLLWNGHLPRTFL